MQPACKLQRVLHALWEITNARAWTQEKTQRERPGREMEILLYEFDWYCELLDALEENLGRDNTSLTR